MILHTMSSFEGHLYKLLFSESQRMQLYEKITSFLDDGIDLHSVLKKLGDKYAENGETDPRSKILLEWAEGMSNGRSFSSCIQQWVPVSESMLVKAGEQAGEISTAIKNAMFATEKVKEMKSKLSSELGYPIMLILALFGMLYMISVKVMPELSAVQSPELWPSGSQSLYALTEFVRTKWYWVFVVLIISFYLISYSLSRLTGPVRRVLDNIQPYSTYRSVQSSIFMISVASQMKTGVPIVDAVQTLEKMSNRYISWHLREILLRLNSGVVVGRALNTGFMDRETGVDIEVFGATSNLQDSMETIGNRSIDNTMSSIVTMAGGFRALSLGLLAGFIGWTFMSIQSITQAIASAAGV